MTEHCTSPEALRAFCTRVLGALDVPPADAGLVADSLVFLWLAFGSLDFLAGQVIGKAWMVVASLPLIHWIRRREA